MKSVIIEKKKPQSYSLLPSTINKIRDKAHKDKTTASILVQEILDNAKELK